MLRLDRSWLTTAGLGDLPTSVGNCVLRYVYETLQRRVGERLSEQMTPGQLDELELLKACDDTAGAISWLHANFPDYGRVVAEEFALLGEELAAQRELLLAVSRAARA
jgi:hypothetical protein